jgi:hypothetical protein
MCASVTGVPVTPPCPTCFGKTAWIPPEANENEAPFLWAMCDKCGLSFKLPVGWQQAGPSYMAVGLTESDAPTHVKSEPIAYGGAPRCPCPHCGASIGGYNVLATTHWDRYYRCPHDATTWRTRSGGVPLNDVAFPAGSFVCSSCETIQPMFEKDGRAVEVCWSCCVIRHTAAQILHNADGSCYKCGSHNIRTTPVADDPGVVHQTCLDCNAHWLRGAKIPETDTIRERYMALDIAPDTSNEDRLVQEVDTLIRARYPLISIETHEEPRLLRIMSTIASLKHHEQKGLFTWSRIEGIRQIAGPGTGVNPKPIPDTMDPVSALEHIASQDKGIYLLCDFAPYLAPYGQEAPELVRQLRELAWSIKAKAVTVFLIGPETPDIKGLGQGDMTVTDLPLPDENEVRSMLEFHVARLAENKAVTNDVSHETRDKLVSSLLGLSEMQVENVLAKSAIKHKGITPAALPVILQEKKEAIRASGSLEYHDPEPLSHYGGYGHVTDMLKEDALTFTPEAQEYGVDAAKGMLLIGLPGVGKDLLKRVASGVLGRPLVDFDFGSVMGEGGGIVGQAAMSIKRAISITDTIKPVLGISEFEKGVGGLASSSRSDAGETARTIGILLNWMQEQNGTYVVATANDVRQLAPEQVRQGRFGRILFVDLPTHEDRKAIFTVWLTRKKRDPAAFDLDALAEMTKGYSGAEIEAVVKGALLMAFGDGARPLRTDDMLARAKKVTPIGVLKKQEIDEIRSWARDHLGAVDASGADAPKPRAGERQLEF